MYARMLTMPCRSPMAKTKANHFVSKRTSEWQGSNIYRTTHMQPVRFSFTASCRRQRRQRRRNVRACVRAHARERARVYVHAFVFALRLPLAHARARLRV